MGEVVLARDAKIGRDVAIKRMRAASPSADALDRFLREARIQARLDHPAIVPVHDLGEDSEGRPYFTMKRLAGTTLHDEIARSEPSLQRLLRAFVDVCMAVEFAHSRGVVHRDLKPHNIMLGDYGEVYVLDWGIARVIGEKVAGGANAGDISTLEGNTQVGALLGTPGYMAPEQVRGEDVGPAADVYALGCMLFEILAGEPLHPRGTNPALASTLTAAQNGPAQRKPDRGIAPELDAACTAALVAEPGERPSARGLADRIQRYLDGDRDLERRRSLAADELAAARTAAEDPKRRADAIRHAGRAVVLDPTSNDAAKLVLELLIDPPTELPADLERTLAAHEEEIGSRTARTAVLAALSYFLFIPLLLWAGVRQWPIITAFYALAVVLCGHAYYQSRTGRVQPLIPLLCNIAMMTLLSRLLSPWVFVPAIVCMFVMTLTAQNYLWRRPLFIIVIGTIALALPLVLEAVGVFDRTWSIEHGRLVIESTAVAITGAPTVVFLLAGSIGTIVVAAIFSRSMAQTQDVAHRRVEIQAWHLRQLLPVDAPPPATPKADPCELLVRK
jgi:serine/threonine-protein kinase